MAINNLIISGPNNNNNNGSKKPGQPSNPTSGNNGSGNGPKGPVAPTNMSQVPDDTIPPELINYNELAQQGKFKPVQFRDDEIIKMLAVLSTVNHPNVLLTGEAGVGKTALAKQLALDLVSDDDTLAKQLLDPKTVIYALPITNLIAGGGIVGTIEQRVKNIIDFATDPNNHAILYLDEIHQLFTSHDSTTNSITQQLKPALADPDLHVIASTTKSESMALKKDPAFRRRFSEVLVPELTNAQTKEVLTELAPNFSDVHHVYIDDKNFDYLIAKANEYAPVANSHRPDSAITLLDRTCADVHLRALQLAKQMNAAPKKLTVSKAAIELSAKHLLNIDQIDESKAIDTLSTNLDEHVIGQNNAKAKLIDMMKRQQLNLLEPTQPTSFLFAGPTGTGKTEMVKQLVQSLYGNLNHLITINMTEYASNASITNLIGSSRGYVGSDSNQELPFDKVLTDPYQIILLDEFEKAGPAVKKLFLRILDEGKLDDKRGQHFDFNHCLIIATTNAGSSAFAKPKPTIGFAGPAEHKVSKADLIKALRQAFPIELLNRFSHMVLFEALSKADYANVLKVKYNDLLKRITAHQPGLNLTPNHLDLAEDYDVIDNLASKTYNPMFNGRPAQRTMQAYIENQILAHPQQPQIDLMTMPSTSNVDTTNDDAASQANNSQSADQVDTNEQSNDDE